MAQFFYKHITKNFCVFGSCLKISILVVHQILLISDSNHKRMVFNPVTVIEMQQDHHHYYCYSLSISLWGQYCKT